MKKLIATMLITLLLCTSTLFAADTEDNTYIPSPSKRMFLTTTFSPVTTGLGIGYRNNRFEKCYGNRLACVPEMHRTDQHYNSK